ncbi:hypothetical protein K502DRAFT_352253 [Neoconidiobolus thromboides FSU 785]|nr:hypothetical protein K502DRAFT_352253 [Neoconidiobolus thromboides FSU 785]
MKTLIVVLALAPLVSSSFITNNSPRFIDTVIEGVKGIGSLIHDRVVADRSYCLNSDNMISRDMTKKCCSDIYKGGNLIHFNELEFFCSFGDDRLKGCCEENNLSFCKGECKDRKF